MRTILCSFPSLLLTLLFLVDVNESPASAQDTGNGRMPKTDMETKYWLENMVWYHRFSLQEIQAATGLTASQIAAAQKQWQITPETRPLRGKGAPLLMLPYPGGRHPRIGFLDGAIRPQRETKFSVFLPWDQNSYVVVDLPEAIWSNLGLTYLAHTHVPTIWTKKSVSLEQLEWSRETDGSLELTRVLPNGISYTARATPTKQAIRMELSLTNDTQEKLSDLRVQICVLLAKAAGFEQQNNDNKLFLDPYVVCRSKDGKKWIITAWESFHRGWANPQCPCIHADPKFPDILPGQTRHIRGWLSFYEGEDIRAEIDRIDKTGWRKGQSRPD